jgi:hypothetical protein
VSYYLDAGSPGEYGQPYEIALEEKDEEQEDDDE